MVDILKIVKPLEESGLLVKSVSEIVENEAKEQNGGFVPILLAALPAGSLGSVLTGRGRIRAGEETNLKLMVFIQEIIYL